MKTRALLTVTAILLLAACSRERTDYLPVGEETRNNLSYGSNEFQRYDAFLPAGRGTATPVVLLIHGGGWVSGDKSYCTEYARYLRRKGYAAFSMNYRLAHGTAHTGEMLDDIRSMLQVIRDNAPRWNLSGTRVALFGQSAGGHLALLYAYSQVAPVDIAGVVSVSGPTDLCDTALWADPALYADIRTLTGDTLTEHWASASPVTWLDAGDPPTLLVHGATDSLVPVSQAYRLSHRSDAIGAAEQLVIFPSEDHYFSYEAFVNTVEATDLFLRERFPNR